MLLIYGKAKSPLRCEWSLWCPAVDLHPIQGHFFHLTLSVPAIGSRSTVKKHLRGQINNFWTPEMSLKNETILGNVHKSSSQHKCVSSWSWLISVCLIRFCKTSNQISWHNYEIKKVVGVAINASKTEVQWGKVIMPNQSMWLAWSTTMADLLHFAHASFQIKCSVQCVMLLEVANPVWLTLSYKEQRLDHFDFVSSSEKYHWSNITRVHTKCHLLSVFLLTFLVAFQAFHSIVKPLITLVFCFFPYFLSLEYLPAG